MSDFQEVTAMGTMEARAQFPVWRDIVVFPILSFSDNVCM